MKNNPTVLKSKIRDVKFGTNCKIVEPSNLYECQLGNNVFVGPFVEITKGVKNIEGDHHTNKSLFFRK